MLSFFVSVNRRGQYRVSKDASLLFTFTKIWIEHATQLCTAYPILFISSSSFFTLRIWSRICFVCYSELKCLDEFWMRLHRSVCQNTESEARQRSGKSRFHMNPRVGMELASGELPWSACMPKPELIPAAAWTLLSPEEAGSYHGGGQEDTECRRKRESGGGWAVYGTLQNFT